MKIRETFNFLKNEIQNAVLHRLAAAPEGAVEGQEYFDTTKKQHGVYSGTEWVYGSTLAEATEAALGGIKLAGDLKGGTGAAPHVTNLHLEGDTAINHKLTSVTDPTAAQDAATKNYVDGRVNGLNWKDSVNVATFAALPAYTQSGSGATGSLEANANGALTVDGVAMVVGMRVWVTLAVEEKHNGIYEVIKAGGAGEKWKLTRTADAATPGEVENATAFTHEGTELADHEFTVSNTGAIVVDTTALKVIEYQNGTTTVGDGTYTTRSGNKIALKPDESTPAVPAEGAVSAVSAGAARLKRFAITGDGSKTEFTVTHNLGTKLLLVSFQENTGGEPTNPTVIDWAPGTANTIAVKFVTAPAKGETFFCVVGA